MVSTRKLDRLFEKRNLEDLLGYYSSNNDNTRETVQSLLIKLVAY